MKVFVGCSSRDEIAKEYFTLAEEVGRCLQNHDVIIGGTEEGMMGSVVKNLDHFKRIVLKDYLNEDTVIHDLDIVCDTSFERLQLIWENTDLFFFLPGGTGTLGEMLSFLEENRTKKQKKKIILFNYHHYYDNVVAFVKQAEELKFCNQDILEGIRFIESIQDFKKEILEDVL